MSQVFSLMAVQIALRVDSILFDFDKILKGPLFCLLLHISDLHLLIFVSVTCFSINRTVSCGKGFHPCN